VAVADKLQIRPGQRVVVLRQPTGVELAIGAAQRAEDAPTADAVVLFATTAADLSSDEADALVNAALRDALAWVAYPKGGQLGTDLNRDSLAELLSTRGVRPVRQVAVDEVWSALRFRPGS
jgi:hypothetical protein